MLTLVVLVLTKKRFRSYRTRVDLPAITAASYLSRKRGVHRHRSSVYHKYAPYAMSQDAVELKEGSRGRTTTRTIFAKFIKSHLSTQNQVEP